MDWRRDPIARLLILLLIGSPLTVWAVLSGSIWVLALAIAVFFGTLAWWLRRYGR